MSPMLKKYREAKSRHPDMILLFRMGDFYETIDEDAELCSRVLGLTLTLRNKTTPMAGFPVSSLEHYLRTLLTAGHRVAICEQADEADEPVGRSIDASDGRPTLF